MRSGAYEDEGRIFPVVLNQGHRFNRSMWAPQRDFSALNTASINLDPRGYGEHSSERKRKLFRFRV
jgi:hypothetical protein